TRRKSNKEIFGLLKVILKSNKEILKFLKEIFMFLSPKIAKKWLGFSKIGDKFSRKLRIVLKIRLFRQLRKTGIFRTKIFGDDFVGTPEALKTGGRG
ncbi:MAG: hypothetical protein IKR91_01790, partial [Alloprevotella sp.]|nr:hypothetical protein [Alloprevotella sp.]